MQEMSNSSYQRAMADMQQAGLNPILAQSHGGAQTPSLQAPGSSAPSSFANAARTVAMDYPQSQASVAETKERTSFLKKQETKSDEESKLIREQQRLTKASARSASADADRKQVMNSPFSSATDAVGAAVDRNKQRLQKADKWLKDNSPAAAAASAKEQNRKNAGLKKMNASEAESAGATITHGGANSANRASSMTRPIDKR